MAIQNSPDGTQKKVRHKDLAAGRWFTFTLCEQLGNVGSEVGRAVKWLRAGDMAKRDSALERAFELLDFTIQDPRWRKERRLKEILRSREVLADVFYGDNEYKSSPEAMEKYFYHFAVAARR